MSLLKSIVAIACLLVLPAGAEDRHAPQDGPIQTPEAIRTEHQHLHEQLEAAMSAGGKTGQAAKKVQQVLAPHFAEEEKLAMPPLGLLDDIAQGKVTPEMRPAIAMGEKLRANLPRFLEEHEKIKAALKDLEAAASAEDKPEQIEFARKLILHAQHEEQVLYPAAILVGEHVRMKLQEK